MPSPLPPCLPKSKDNGAPMGAVPEHRVPWGGGVAGTVSDFNYFPINTTAASLIFYTNSFQSL